MKAYLIKRRIRLIDGGEVVLPVRYCDDRATAESMARELQQGMSQWLGFRIVAPDGSDTGSEVRTYMGDMGLTAFIHDVSEVTISGALVTPQPRGLVTLS